MHGSEGSSEDPFDVNPAEITARDRGFGSNFSQSSSTGDSAVSQKLHVSAVLRRAFSKCKQGGEKPPLVWGVVLAEPP